ncbi:MAG: ABC transporter substrate-binding protein [Pseudobdellovibrio sp.]|nr:ABC transporter substrate-binding protein [Pseudobdellovibrio sp.]
MKIRIVATFCLFFSLNQNCVSASTPLEKKPLIVKVGVVHFPPYIELEDNGKIGGIVMELLDYMNSIQSSYKFKPVHTSSMRKIRDFNNHSFDVGFFDNLKWGWDKTAVDASQVYMRGKEIYIAKKKQGRNEHYFDDFTGKSMVGMLGYHYSFANFNSDAAYLRKNYNMQTSTSNEGSIKMILHGRGDIAIVSDAFLHRYFTMHPETRAKILISNKVDQHYLLSAIVRKNIRPSVQEINDLLAKFKQSEQFKSMQKRYGITP